MTGDGVESVDRLGGYTEPESMPELIAYLETVIAQSRCESSDRKNNGHGTSSSDSKIPP